MRALVLSLILLFYGPNSFLEIFYFRTFSLLSMHDQFCRKVWEIELVF